MMFFMPFSIGTLRYGAEVRTGASQEITGVRDAMRKIRAQDGVRGLYRGMAVSLYGNIVYRGLYFGLFDSGKQALVKPGGEKPNVLAVWAMAQMTTLTAAVGSYPLNIIRIRMQMDCGRKEKLHVGNINDCARKIYATEGVRGFYRGVTFSSGVQATAGALLLVANDWVTSDDDED